MSQPNPETRAATMRAIDKALTLHTAAQFVPDLSLFMVQSASVPDRSYQVSLDPEGVQRSGELVHFVCTCHAGEHRRELAIPCYHAAAAALEMERLGLLERRDGIFVAKEPDC